MALDILDRVGDILPSLPSSGSGGMSMGGSITSATQGSVLFAGASGVLAQDNANLFWDDTNDALGIGTNSPNADSAKLSIFPNQDCNAIVGRLKINCTTISDHVLLAHYDLGTTATNFQIRMDPDGDTTIQAVAGTMLVGHTTASGSVLFQSNGTTRIGINSTGLGFFAATPAAKQSIAGSRSANAALADLLTKLATIGLITDGTTA